VPKISFVLQFPNFKEQDGYHEKILYYLISVELSIGYDQLRGAGT
jgi:hypothetical protein